MIKLKKMQPMFTGILTTLDVSDKDEYSNGLVVSTKGSLKPIQTVLAVGDAVSSVKVGDKVLVNFEHYAVKKYDEGSMNDGVVQMNKTLRYEVNDYEVDGKRVLLLDLRDIIAKVEAYEAPDIEVVKPKIVKPM